MCLFSGTHRAILFFIFSTSIFSIETLTLKEAISKTSLNNPSLKISKINYQKSILEYKKAEALFLPSLDLSISYRRQANEPGSNNITQNNNSTNEGSSGYSYRNQYSMGITANQNLFAGLRDNNTLKKLSNLVKASNEDYQNQKILISYDLLVSFERTLYSQKLIVLSETIKQRRQQNTRLVQLYYEGGKEHRGNYLLSQASLNQANFDLENAKRELKIQTTELSRVMGILDYVNFEIKGELTLPNLPQKPDFEMILSSHPDIIASRLRILAARNSIEIADSRYYPELNVSANVAHRDSTWVPKRKSWYIGLSLDYPLFRGKEDLYNIKLARKDHEKLIYELQNKKNQLLYELEKSFQEFKGAIEYVNVLDKFYNAANTRAKIARAQYSTGLLRFENWDIIESDLIQKQRNLLSAKRDARIAEAKWNLTYGKSILP